MPKRYNLDRYDPSKDRLPSNHQTRRALASQAKRQQRRQERLASRLEAALAPYVGKLVTPEVHAALTDRVAALLGITKTRARVLVEAGLKPEASGAGGAQ